MVAYAAFAAALFGVARIWAKKGWIQGLCQLLLLVLFAVSFWLFESWAFYRTPYYFYPPLFPDMVDPFRWDLVSWFPGSVPSLCDVPTPPRDMRVSASILLVEAALTYTVMWTTDLLDAPRLLRPFLAGLIFLGVDLFLDPVLAKSYDCTSGGIPPGLLPNGDGLGFWHWDVTEELGAWWFGIPVFNFASWYAAPVVLIALSNVVYWLIDFWLWLRDPVGMPKMPSRLEFASLIIVVAALLLIVACAPTNAVSPVVKAILLAAVVAASVIATLFFASGFDHANPWRWELCVPPAVGAVFPLVAFLATGLVRTVPLLWVVPLVTVPLVLLFAVSPYLRAR